MVMVNDKIIVKMRATVVLTFIGFIFVIMFLTGCDPNVAIMGEERVDHYTSVYMPQSEGGTKMKVLPAVEEPQCIYFGAAYGGIGYPSQDIEVTFRIDETVVENFNNANGTAYPLLPQETYFLSGTTAVIPSGKTTSSVLKVMVTTRAIVPAVTYLLPVRIEKVKGDIRVNEKLAITYFLIRVSS
jgi:hypothetical protein